MMAKRRFAIPEFKMDDRVRLKDGCADGFIQPWRGRFAKGRLGTVMGESPSGAIRVQWDHAPRYNACNYQLDMRDNEIEVIA